MIATFGLFLMVFFFFYHVIHMLLGNVEVNAFQCNVRPRSGIIFGKSVRCCLQVVFISLMFSPTDGLS